MQWVLPAREPSEITISISKAEIMNRNVFHCSSGKRLYFERKVTVDLKKVHFGVVLFEDTAKHWFFFFHHSPKKTQKTPPNWDLECYSLSKSTVCVCVYVCVAALIATHLCVLLRKSVSMYVCMCGLMCRAYNYDPPCQSVLKTSCCSPHSQG